LVHRVANLATPLLAHRRDKCGLHEHRQQSDEGFPQGGAIGSRIPGVGKRRGSCMPTGTMGPASRSQSFKTRWVRSASAGKRRRTAHLPVQWNPELRANTEFSSRCSSGELPLPVAARIGLVASWYVTSSWLQPSTQPAVKVHEGDTLTGVMTLTGKSGTLFNYTSAFEGIAGTSLPVMNIAELLWCNETLRSLWHRGLFGLSEHVLHCVHRESPYKRATRSPRSTGQPVDKVTDCGSSPPWSATLQTNGRVDLHYRKTKSRFDDRSIRSSRTSSCYGSTVTAGKTRAWGRREDQRSAG
jgi:hypothetical protein